MGKEEGTHPGRTRAPRWRMILRKSNSPQRRDPTTGDESKK